jgi:hypothetical protein
MENVLFVCLSCSMWAPINRGAIAPLAKIEPKVSGFSFLKGVRGGLTGKNHLRYNLKIEHRSLDCPPVAHVVREKRPLGSNPDPDTAVLYQIR